VCGGRGEGEMLAVVVVVVVVVDLKAHQLLRIFAPVHYLNYKILVLSLIMIEVQLKVKTIVKIYKR
jgi:hypothetical protein